MTIKDKLTELLENDEHIALISKQKIVVLTNQPKCPYKFFDEYLTINERFIIPYSSIDMIFVIDSETRKITEEITNLESNLVTTKLQDLFDKLGDAIRDYIRDTRNVFIYAQFDPDDVVF